ncbi:glycerophosphodiester phosphodiesterase family protein [Pedobacter sp. SYSU D00535]|uniref:glycerophosphodiester phosphodiesterase family protein n=1 Tax=Pedobacter sp. SYSU D00535 TaxID=2810308 RepID=UPI001A97912A|nr:glycerophosphodiester phosphodiesterase family protein [Pedobacter sp. SYSU D00535]
MKKLIATVLLGLGILQLVQAQSKTAVRAKIEGIFKPENNAVLTCAHRGDWRNAPENTLQALYNSIEMGVDIMEVDLGKSKDGHLILMHDKTLDRTVKAKGKPGDYTLAELKSFPVRNGTGHATHHRIPTFEELMLAAKDKIIINIDKGYQYLDDVVEVLQKTGTMDQAILSINKNLPLDSVKAKHPNLPQDLLIMPVIDFRDEQAASAAMASYRSKKRVIYQLDFSNDTHPLLNMVPALKKEGNGVWYNSIWPELSGGHHDDKAVDESKPDESWGWLVKKDADVIQTDRPFQLVNYLRKINNGKVNAEKQNGGRR